MPTAPSLKGRALRFLAAREHARDELRRKLALHARDGQEVEQVLDDLETRGLLSEARFVESVIHRRAARHGAARIRQELAAHGVSPERAREAVLALQDSELSRARDIWRQRFGTPATDARERARQARFLLARGFSGEVVRQVLRSGTDDDDPPLADSD